MSNPTKINSGIVTTLAATDLVVGVDSGGATLKPITLDNLLAIMRSSLQIGGRNLVPDSDKPMNQESSPGYSFADGVHSLSMPFGGMGICKRIGSFPIGEYTVSVDLKADSPLSVRWYVGNNEASAKTFNVNNEWKRYTATLTPTVEALQVRLVGTTLGIKYYARNIKIERGNVATDWSPAPEDLGWGGVNQRFTITYDLLLDIVQKGGSHEPADNVCRHPEIGDCCIIDFRSIDAACEWLGRAAEMLDTSTPDSADSRVRCGRVPLDRSIQTRGSDSQFPLFLGIGEHAVSPEMGQQRSLSGGFLLSEELNYLPYCQKSSLAVVETSDADCPLVATAGKEVTL